MIKQYECLDCNAINEIAILELRDFNNPLFCRISCYKCGSIKVCRIYPNNDQKFIINADLVAPYLDSRIVAMTEEQRKLEQILVIIGRLTIDLSDLYRIIDNVSNALTITDKGDFNYIRECIKNLELSNESLLVLIGIMKLIDKI